MAASYGDIKKQLSNSNNNNQEENLSEVAEQFLVEYKSYLRQKSLGDLRDRDERGSDSSIKKSISNYSKRLGKAKIQQLLSIGLSEAALFLLMDGLNSVKSDYSDQDLDDNDYLLIESKLFSLVNDFLLVKGKANLDIQAEVLITRFTLDDSTEYENADDDLSAIVWLNQLYAEKECGDDYCLKRANESIANVQLIDENFHDYHNKCSVFNPWWINDLAFKATDPDLSFAKRLFYLTLNDIEISRKSNDITAEDLRLKVLSLTDQLLPSFNYGVCRGLFMVLFFKEFLVLAGIGALLKTGGFVLSKIPLSQALGDACQEFSHMLYYTMYSLANITLSYNYKLIDNLAFPLTQVINFFSGKSRKKLFPQDVYQHMPIKMIAFHLNQYANQTSSQYFLPYRQGAVKIAIIDRLLSHLKDIDQQEDLSLDEKLCNIEASLKRVQSDAKISISGKNAMRAIEAALEETTRAKKSLLDNNSARFYDMKVKILEPLKGYKETQSKQYFATWREGAKKSKLIQEIADSISTQQYDRELSLEDNIVKVQQTLEVLADTKKFQKNGNAKQSIQDALTVIADFCALLSNKAFQLSIQ